MDSEQTNIRDLDDPRLAPFRDLRSRKLPRSSGVFIAEGPFLVHALLNSRFESLGVLVDQRHAERFAHELPPGTKMLVAETELLQQVVGFNFHRGILACGRREQERQFSSADLLASQQRVVPALVGIEDPENLGTILRTCAGLGMSQVIIGEGCCDPFSRRALRVSMGATLSLDLHISSDIHQSLEDLTKLQGIEIIATTLGPDAESLQECRVSPPTVVMLGNENAGLPQELLDLATRKVSIKMHADIDSLNVAVAAGIILHYFDRLGS
ncbi:MAG TPA: hypothetical protein DDW52_08395 [Planctomycetaceae bacterium]|nr:hypothetical protein [Planctomycetaceae bacterium]